MVPVGPGEIDAQAADLGGQQKYKDFVIGVEVVNQPCARSHRR